MRTYPLEKFEKQFNTKLVPCIDEIYKIKLNQIKVSPAVRLKCMNCGSYKRKKTCSPFVWSLTKVRRFLRDNVDYCYLIVARNDGTRAWWFDDAQRDMTLSKKSGLQLKGTNIGMQLYCHRFLKSLVNAPEGRQIALAMAPGPCHRCKKCLDMNPCPEPPPLFSLEGLGINVYGMLTKLKIPYENPVVNELVAVSLICIAKEEKHETNAG